MRILFSPIILFYGWLVLPQLLPAAETDDYQLSQRYLVHAWQTDDGLPQNWVSSITQTPDGYLWIGTRYGGLARFDGLRFVGFNPGNTPEMKDVQVESADVDETGNLWVIMGNESITRIADGRFQLFRQPRSLPRLRPQFVLLANSNSVLFGEEGAKIARVNLTTNQWDLLNPDPAAAGPGRVFRRDQSGAVWYISDTGGLGRFYDGRFEARAVGPLLPTTRVTAITTDPQGRLWVASSSQIFRRQGDAFIDETPTNGPPAYNIQDLVVMADGGFWVRNGHHLRSGAGREWSVNVDLGEAIHRDNTVRRPQLFADVKGNAWLIDYGHGLWCASTDGSAVELTESNGLPNEFITCWFQDREDNIWVGTVGGMARISKRVVRILGQAENLPGKIARSVCMDDQGTLWAGTMSGGLAYWQSNSFVRLNFPNVNPVTPLESVTVCPTHDGSLWVGTLRRGLMQYQGGEFKRPLPVSDLAYVRILFEDSQRRLWIGGLADLLYYQQGRFRRLETADGFQSSIATGAIAEDTNGVIWIGTGPGDLWKFQDNKFTRFPPPDDEPSFRFASLLADADGSIWCGTLGGGLLRFKAGRFSRFTSREDLPNAFVSQLREDQLGHLWLGTYAGIVRISKANLNAVADGHESHLVCRIYGRSSGLLALECSSGFQPSCWTAPDGVLWFSTAAGLAAINPNDRVVSPKQSPPPVVIEEVSVDGVQRNVAANGEISTPVTADRPELQIEAGQHFMQFRYTGLSLTAPDEVTFRVKLEGAESNWRNLGYQRTVGYGPLAPGHYRLLVLAVSREGLWNEPGAALAFYVRPFFWQTYWFKGSLLGVLVLATGLVFTLGLTRKHRLEVRKLRAQNELDRERARIAQDLHDDLGTTLTQINLLSSLADRETSSDEVKSLNRQIRLSARAMVVAMDEIVWAVNPRNDTAAEVVNYVASFAEEFFQSSPISCRLEIPVHLPAGSLSSEMRHHLFLVFKECINNVARHSRASHVWISVVIAPHEMSIRIKDDGQGFDPAKSNFKPGNGLLNIQSRMAEIGGRAEIQSVPAQGTTVVIHMPLNKS